VGSIVTLVSCSPSAGLAVTFVDNDCFLIASEGQKILFDPHERLSQNIRKQLREGEAPFDGIDLILVTHTHSDHFDSKLVGEILRRNPQALFGSTQQAVNDLQGELEDYSKITERVWIFEPGEGDMIEAELKGVKIKVMNFPHGVPIMNLGFIFEIDGWRVLHTGDVAKPEILEMYDLSEAMIDVAFVPYIYLLDGTYRSEKGRNTVLEEIGADQVVPMHYAVDKTMVGDLEEALTKSQQEGVIFQEALETAIFE
jgi:L-ascorbate metabolism protein UlaG (beta-lactamase superfamily)